MLCEVTKQKKKAQEEKVLAKKERKMDIRIEERSSNVQNITNTQLDMMNQLMLVN